MGRRSDLFGPGKQPQQESGQIREMEPRDPRILGSGDFVEQLLHQIEPDPLPAKVSLEEIIECVVGKFNLSLEELTSQTRSSRIANARSIICHLAFASGHRGVDIARKLGITGSGVTIAAQRGEKAVHKHPELLNMLE